MKANHTDTVLFVFVMLYHVTEHENKSIQILLLYSGQRLQASKHLVPGLLAVVSEY